MTLPPQMYPLHPIVAPAWAALGAGARPCKTEIKTSENLSWQILANLIIYYSVYKGMNHTLTDSHGSVVHSNWIAWGQIHEPHCSIPRRHLQPAENNKIVNQEQRN